MYDYTAVANSILTRCIMSRYFVNCNALHSLALKALSDGISVTRCFSFSAALTPAWLLRLMRFGAPCNP